jgi:hypothetical protein
MVGGLRLVAVDSIPEQLMRILLGVDVLISAGVCWAGSWIERM